MNAKYILYTVILTVVGLIAAEISRVIPVVAVACPILFLGSVGFLVAAFIVPENPH